MNETETIEKMRDLLKANRALLIVARKTIEDGLAAVSPQMAYGGQKSVVGYCEQCRTSAIHGSAFGACPCWCHRGFRLSPKIQEQLQSTDALLIELGESLEELNKDRSMRVEATGTPHRHACAAGIHETWTDWRNPGGIVLGNDPCTCVFPTLPQCCGNHPLAKAKLKTAETAEPRFLLARDVSDRALDQLDN
jgi:hypothetical protein